MERLHPGARRATRRHLALLIGVNRYADKRVPALEGAREAFRSAVRCYKEATANYDVIMTPTLATKPWPIGHLSPTHATTR